MGEVEICGRVIIYQHGRRYYTGCIIAECIIAECIIPTSWGAMIAVKEPLPTPGAPRKTKRFMIRTGRLS